MLGKGSKILREHLDIQLASDMARSLARVLPIRLTVYDPEGTSVCSPSYDSPGPPIPSQIACNSPLLEAVHEAMARADGVRGSECVTVGDDDRGVGLVAPIWIEGESAGALVGFSGQAAAPAGGLDGMRSLLASYARVLAEDARNRHLVGDLGKEVLARYEEISLVYKLHDALDISKDRNQALDVVLNSVAQTLDASLLVLSVPGLRVSRAFPGGEPEEGGERGARFGLQVLTEILERRSREAAEGIVINDLSQDDEIRPVAGGFSHALAAPITVDRDHGVFVALRKEKDSRFFAGDIRLFGTVAAQAAIILGNAKAMETRQQLLAEIEMRNTELTETRDVSVFALARLAESRDYETGLHLERIRMYAALLANGLKETEEYADYITPEYVADLYRSSPLHDIGKVGIPDSVLLKPGKLTPDEWEIMKTHTTIGGDTLRDAENLVQTQGRSFLSVGRAIAYCHHEKWDGSGYPTGVAEDAIPLSARIVGLADAYDAMTSKRCYKEAFSHEKTREIIVQDSGSHFDPDVAEAFLAEEAEFVDIKERLADAGSGP
jgi:response regulator RpfG family c-di-GMP phosphodiesterase